MRCPHCGAELAEGAVFCPYCMTSLTKKTEIAPLSGKRRAPGVWALCLLLLLLAAAAPVFFLLRGAGDPPPALPAESGPATTESAAAGTEKTPVPDAETAAETGAAATERPDTAPAITESAETITAKTKSAETAPAETAPAETAAHTQPVAGTGPAETEKTIPPLTMTGVPVTGQPETEPAVTEPAETKSAETAPAETASAETTAAPYHPYHISYCDPRVEPTCTQPGLTAGTHCSLCGEILIAQQIIPPVGHNFGAPGYTRPATCMNCGETTGSPLPPPEIIITYGTLPRNASYSGYSLLRVDAVEWTLDYNGNGTYDITFIFTVTNGLSFPITAGVPCKLCSGGVLNLDYAEKKELLPGEQTQVKSVLPEVTGGSYYLYF